MNLTTVGPRRTCFCCGGGDDDHRDPVRLPPSPSRAPAIAAAAASAAFDFASKLPALTLGSAMPLAATTVPAGSGCGVAVWEISNQGAARTFGCCLGLCLWRFFVTSALACIAEVVDFRAAEAVLVEVAGLLVLFGCFFSMVVAAVVPPSHRFACIGTAASPTVLLPSLIPLLSRRSGEFPAGWDSPTMTCHCCGCCCCNTTFKCS